jgi:hypothetical protein
MDVYTNRIAAAPLRSSNVPYQITLGREQAKAGTDHSPFRSNQNNQGITSRCIEGRIEPSNHV